MDYEIPESLRMMQETIRRFVKQDLEPISQKVEDEDHIPEEIVQKMRDSGAVRPLHPRGIRRSGAGNPGRMPGL